MIKAFFRRTWGDFKKSLKFRYMAIVSFLFIYIVPIVYILIVCYEPRNTSSWLTVWAFPIIIVFALIYFKSFRKYMKTELAKEETVARIDFSKTNTFKLTVFEFIDAIVHIGMVAMLYWLTVVLVQVQAFTSAFFRIILISVAVGYLCRIIDLVINIGRQQIDQEKE